MTLKEIASYVGISCQDEKEIIGLNTLTNSNENELTFLENKKYLSDLKNTKAAAVLVTKENEAVVPSNTIALVCDEPYLMLAKISKLFAPNIVEKDGLEPIIGKDTVIMPNAYIGKNSSIGNNCIIMAGSFIGDNVSIGDNTIIYPNVTVYRDCKIGSECIIHAGTVIGSDGFGFANTKDGKYIKIYQNGNVTVGNDVEIGANCAIDRAVFKSTIIEDGVRLDNLVHIAHNCKIGRGSILVGQVGLAGSTILNHYVVMGGQSATAGHLEIAPFTTIAARGGVTKSITEPKKSWAGFPLFEHRQWLKLQGKISNLLK
uniref:UDP-3-O-(3-hydroxymyristoyl)glucosamine N-acyltransferase n=1 Tax=Aliarcobacter sp. TaxID=2321116 RepID=UPI0040486976